jgi:hypothetical protein
MSSHEDYAAFLASIRQRPDNRVIGVIQPVEPAAESRSNPPAYAPPDYTITPITQLHGSQETDTKPRLSVLLWEIIDGLAALDKMAPLAGFSADRWTTMVKAMWRFGNQHAMDALQLGWTVTDLFGLNPYAPATRVDGRGIATMLSEGERVVKISSDAIVIEKPSGAHLTFRPNNGAPSVPAWKLR